MRSAAFYTDHDKVDHRTRVLAYLKAMEGVAQRNPNDDEAQIFYAITLNVAASPNDKTYANQLKGAAILEPIFKRQPRHPGVAHYLIHLYDTPALAEKGLDAARRYAEIAPAAPHAQHMPSHIFTRVGYWKESITSNIASARAAKDGKEPNDQLHAMDYLVYAYLQLGQDAKARAVIDEMIAIGGFTETFIAGPYAIAASPSALCGGARRLEGRGGASGPARVPLAYVQAMTHFARALGAARSGKPGRRQGRHRQARRAARESCARPRTPIGRSRSTSSGRSRAPGCSYAEGKHDDALKAMSAAADAEDKTEKHPVTPGVPTPRASSTAPCCSSAAWPRRRSPPSRRR